MKEISFKNHYFRVNINSFITQSFQKVLCLTSFQIPTPYKGSQPHVNKLWKPWINFLLKCAKLHKHAESQIGTKFFPFFSMRTLNTVWYQVGNLFNKANLSVPIYIPCIYCPVDITPQTKSNKLHSKACGTLEALEVFVMWKWHAWTHGDNIVRQWSRVNFCSTYSSGVWQALRPHYM